MVAGHIRAGQLGVNLAERGRLCPALLDGAVGDVADVAHDVGVEGVDRVDDPGRPAGPVDRAVVGVGEQHHRDAVEARTQPRDGDVHPADAGYAHRLDVAPHRQRERHDGDCGGDDPRPGRVGYAADDQAYPEHVADDRPGEQEPDHAEDRVAGAGRPVQVAPAVSGHHERRERKERAEAQDRAGADDRGGPPAARDEQRPPRNAQQQQPDAGERRTKPQHPQGSPRWRCGWNRFGS